MGKNKEKKKHGFLGVLLRIALLICILAGALAAANVAVTLNLRKYIDSFDSVDYSQMQRKLPELDEKTGYYSFSTDEDLKIVMLTDLHIGGGISSVKQDKKTVYEVITMLQAEKPDLVILCGDNTFAVPGPGFNGGSTFNNKMAAKTVIHLFEHEKVYFSTVFGNHDTEAFDFFSREQIGKTYEEAKGEYCIFRSDFSDRDNKMPSVSNQIITIKNTSGKITKLLLLLDSNAYKDTSLSATINWEYDTIHQAQVDWAKEQIAALSEAQGLKDGECLKTIAFFHIPTGEFQTAYKELEAVGFKDTENCKYIEGVWDEEVNEELGIRIWYAGCSDYRDNPEDSDMLFETLGPDGLDSLEAVFCGHDHVNNAVVDYRGVMLAYGYSLDNLAYDDIAEFGRQRGCTEIVISPDGGWKQVHLNAYEDLGADTDKFGGVYLDRWYYEDFQPR